MVPAGIPTSKIRLTGIKCNVIPYSDRHFDHFVSQRHSLGHLISHVDPAGLLGGGSGGLPVRVLGRIRGDLGPIHPGPEAPPEDTSAPGVPPNASREAGGGQLCPGAAGGGRWGEHLFLLMFAFVCVDRDDVASL